MQTDLILKRLTELYAADILSLFGLPVAEVLSVETLEMAANAARLDNLVKVRSPQSQEYWHIVEWQGYRDPTILWRVLGYVVRIGQRNPQVAITASIVYLTPECDMGDTIRHEVDGRLLWTWQVQALRMWQQDAPTLLASNKPGLAVLSPLGRNANGSTVEQAARMVIDQVPLPQQADMLSMLGVFAEPIVAINQFVRIVGKERILESKLFTMLLDERWAEEEPKLRQRLQAEYMQQGIQQGIQQGVQEGIQQGIQQSVGEMQQMLTDVITVRYPQAPLSLARTLRQINEPAQLRRLIVAAVQIADFATFEQTLREVAAES